MAKKIQEEKQHHKEAFELYFILPPDKRSVREVARQLKKAPSTIQTWAESFNWKERVEIREANVSKQFREIQAQNDDTLITIKASFHKILKALIAEAIVSVKNKKLKIETPTELIRIMELDLKLLGEEDRAAQNNFQAMVEALQASANMFGVNPDQYTYDPENEGDDREPTDQSIDEQD